MQLRLLQLNMNSENYLPALKDFLLHHEFDILQFQELTGKNSHNGNIHSTIDCFPWLQEVLPHHEGRVTILQRFASDPINSYMGNATFFKKDITCLATSELILLENPTPFPNLPTGFEKIGRKVLSLLLEKEDKQFYTLNAHLSWAKTPIEEPHQREQNKKLIAYVSSLQNPFILSGDFNIQPDQPTVLELEQYAQNLTKTFGITNTLNPRTHRIKNLFPPGIAVDYIFTSPQIKVLDCKIIEDIDLSDHFALTATVEL